MRFIFCLKNHKGMKMKKIILLLSAALSSSAFADNCENARNTYDDVYCTNKLYASADTELNQNYQALRGKLSASQKALLKKSQLVWIRERDAACTTAAGIDVQCRLSTTQERNNWLRERLRECSAIGCKTSALR